jgi:hypothetical protein
VQDENLLYSRVNAAAHAFTQDVLQGKPAAILVAIEEIRMLP